ncbi:hypothetical protein [Spirulina sp. 06S082]|uniref:hypothetical protein n=1 Tax=Spirulina sp. 06S082 TaxID=3110248 RepID=UPI002B20709E|nr:hypothetical protein [Spirulina sp. 06S082]MEA5470794.1 hypothetical protein [Spirulina sp. 06S082]
MIQSLINQYKTYHKPLHSRQSYLSVQNQQGLSSLKRAIALSQGEYSLIFARCESSRLRQQILNQIANCAEISLQEVTLHPSVVHLLDILDGVMRSHYPDALAVMGLESAVNIKTLLEEVNFVRDEFNKSLPLPVIFWVNEKTLAQIKRIAPDFSNHGTTSICFE